MAAHCLQMAELALAKKLEGGHVITVKHHKTGRSKEALVPIVEKSVYSALM